MSERPQRTPAEIIAETEAKLSRLRVRAAKQDAMFSSPEVASLVAEGEELKKSIREAKKALGTSPQSLDARIAKHEAWITKIEAERLEAEAILATAEERKNEIDQEITMVVNSIIPALPEKQQEASN